MSSKKNRDIAQELVDFLLTEDEKKKASAREKEQAKPAAKSTGKPALSNTPSPKESAVDAKTFYFSTQAKTVALPQDDKSNDGEDPTMISAIKPTPEIPGFEISQSTPPPVPAKLAGKKPEQPQVKVQTDKTQPKSQIDKTQIDKTVPLSTNHSIIFGGTQNKSTQVVPDFEQASEKAKAILEEATASDLFKIEMPEANPPKQEPPARQTSKNEKPKFEFNESPSKSMPKELSSQRAKVIFSEVSTLMAGAEAVKVAQARITSLEKERDQLRDETEQLLQASETLQRRFDELKGEHDRLERKHREKVEILEDEKQVLRTRLKAREDELEKIRNENEELKLRFQSDLRKIRVRERELEHRQELMKAEQSTLLQAKDEVILEMKRQLERLHFELDNFRAKSADMNTKLNEYFERNHRTVKALRLALSVLEAGDNDDKNKKVG
jgi:hypothetical protein